MEHKSWQVSNLVARLERERDPWRDAHRFSEDMTECHRVLFDPAEPKAAQRTVF